MEPNSGHAENEGGIVIPLHDAGRDRAKQAKSLRPGDWDPGAREDHLTGLHGHPWFAEDLAGAAQRRRGGENPWVAVAEVEGITPLGATESDEALRAVTVRIHDTLRAGDKMARVGPRRIGLIIDAPTGDEAVIALERIEGEVSSLSGTSDQWPEVGLSIGVAPLWHQDPGEALEEAVRALERAREPGGHTVQMSTGLRPAH